MKISLNWLNSYVDVAEFAKDPEALAEKLTAAGLEVENIEDQAKAFENVVIGHILEKGQHPDADKLSLCKVSTGDETHQIICGAQNHKQGDHVVVALPGAVLPGDFAIKKSKIRGVESNGMLCSESELGLADEADGIIILGDGAPVGVSFAEFQELNDVVFELSVTPNRADCLSHWGLAREIGCVLGREVRFPETEFIQACESTKAMVQLEVKASDLCPRFTGRYISGVEIGPSPAWLKNRLEAIGLNSINNVVDITNYVMMELGQPLHAYDAAEINGSKIIVDRAVKGEKFITLDGTEVDLTGDELMIRDAEKPVGIAGVVGGLNSGVQDHTKDLFIEAAYFTMATVRKTSRFHGIETDAGYRFSRGVDPEGVKRALDRTCQLISQLAGGKVFGDAYDEYPDPVVRPKVTVRTAYLKERLGFDLDGDRLASVLERLNCESERSGEDFMVTAPGYRWDLNIEEDFVEEYARLTGYEQLPETMPATDLEPKPHHASYSLVMSLHKQLQGMGYSQAVNYAFIGDQYQSSVLQNLAKLKNVGLEISEEAVRVKNPLTEELNVMRTSLLPGLIKNIAHNDRHGVTLGSLYEVGPTFYKTDEGYGQRERLAMVVWGKENNIWHASSTPVVFALKSAVEKLLKGLRSKSWRGDNLDFDQVPEFLHPGQSASLFFEGRSVGVIGTLHPSLARELKIRSECALVELDLDKLLRGQPRVPKSKMPSRYPAVERDLAFVVPETTPVGDVMTVMRKAAGPLLTELDVFDVFRGGNLEAGQRSVAFRLVYQDPKNTLEESQIQGLQDKVIDLVDKKLGLSVR